MDIEIGREIHLEGIEIGQGSGTARSIAAEKLLEGIGGHPRLG